MLAADLGVALGTVAVSSRGVVSVPTTLTNTGDAAYKAGGSINYFLSADQTLDSTDALWLSRDLPRINAGGTRTVRVQANAPAQLIADGDHGAVPAGNYYIIAQIDPSDDAANSDTTNDVAASTTTVGVTYQFGSVNGKRMDLTVGLGDGATATFHLDGPGTGTLAVDSAGNISLTLANTTTRSSVSVRTSRRADITLSSVTVNGSLDRLSLDRIDIDGNLTITGSVRSITAGDITGGTVSIGAASRSMDLWLGDLTDVSITSASAIRTLVVGSWVDSDASQDALTAPSIGKLASLGDFDANVEITGNGTSATASTLGGVTINGAANGTWSITGKAGDLIFRSTSDGFGINVTRSLRSFVVVDDATGTVAASSVTKVDIRGDADGLTVLAGANLGTDAALGGSGAGADAFAAGTIGSITVRGSITDSVFAAGLSPTDSILLNGNDTFVTGTSSINRVSVRGDVSTSFFAAPTLPSTARINSVSITTANDPRFVSTLTGTA